jgi:hypothetical protein
MANTLTLQSSNDELKAYFEAVCRIADTNSDEFPINLDEVWPLVYGRKSDAVEALAKDFIQDVDYKVLRQNPQNPLGGRPTNEYHLTTSCFEFFIARKVRPVFEVYRQVFHAARQGELPIMPHNPNPQLQFVQTQIYLAEAISRNLRLNEASRLGMYQSIAEPYRLAIPQYVPSQGVMKSASVLLKEIGSDISAIKFNQLLEAHGYVETLTRPSTGGKTRKFKNVTDKGKAYGENEVNPKNQKETQPHWYVDKFKELYQIVTA